jgi:hypothetical protein
MSESIKSAGQPEARKPLSEFVRKTAEEVRKQPVKSLLWAFFVGIFLTVFPVGRILGLLIGIAVGLLRPVLLLLGLLKVCETIGEGRK